MDRLRWPSVRSGALTSPGDGLPIRDPKAHPTESADGRVETSAQPPALPCLPRRAPDEREANQATKGLRFVSGTPVCGEDVSVRKVCRLGKQGRGGVSGMWTTRCKETRHRLKSHARRFWLDREHRASRRANSCARHGTRSSPRNGSLTHSRLLASGCERWRTPAQAGVVTRFSRIGDAGALGSRPDGGFRGADDSQAAAESESLTTSTESTARSVGSCDYSYERAPCRRKEHRVQGCRSHVDVSRRVRRRSERRRRRGVRLVLLGRRRDPHAEHEIGHDVSRISARAPST